MLGGAKKKQRLENDPPAPCIGGSRALTAKILADLRHVATVLTEIGDSVCILHAECLITWMNPDLPGGLDSAYGLPRTWRQDARLNARDELYRVIAQRYFPGHSARDRAKDLCEAVSHYRTGEFKHHKKRPPGRNGDFYDLLMTCGDPPEPLGLESVRKLLGKTDPVEATQTPEDTCHVVEDES